MTADSSDYADLCGADDLPSGATRTAALGGFALLICRTGDEYFAVENKCPHTGALLTRGRIRGDSIVCPVHGARFLLRDGRHLTPPATSGLRTFATRVRAGRVQVLPVPIDPPGRDADPGASSS